MKKYNRRQENRGTGMLTDSTPHHKHLKTIVDNRPFSVNQAKLIHSIHQNVISNATIQKEKNTNIFRPKNSFRKSETSTATNKNSPAQLSLNPASFSAFIAGSVLSHPQVAFWAASLGNDWNEASLIYDIAKIVPNYATLVNIANWSNHDYGLLKSLAGMAGGNWVPQLTILLDAITNHGGISANALYLPVIINELGGFANPLIIYQVIDIIGVNDVRYASTFIHLAGGVANIPIFITLLSKIKAVGGFAHPRANPHPTFDVMPMMVNVNGNLAQLNKFNDHFNEFIGTPAPGDVVGVAAAAAIPGVAWPTAVRFSHFFSRHTFNFFDFTNIADNNTMWDIGIPLLLELSAAASLINIALAHNGFNRYPGLATPSGALATIGVNHNGHGPVNNIDQFYPQMGTPNTINWTRDEMTAIRNVI